MEEFTIQKAEAPFNMAIATLEALRSILSDIKRISADPYMPDEIKQKLKIGLVKRFYVDATPLLEDPEIVKKYVSVLKLKPKELEVRDKNSADSTGKTKLVYDFELDGELDNYLIKIQLDLQEKGFFMPPRRDKGSAVGFR